MAEPAARKFEPMLYVQRFVDRQHLYLAASVTAHFTAELAGDGPEDYETKTGTAFVVEKQGSLFFVTNRHVFDYNYKPPHGVIPSAKLRGVEIRGYAQPSDLSQPAPPWTWTCTQETSGIAFHPDESTDLAVVSAGRGSFNPGDPGPNCLGMEWLASATEIDGLMPGEEIFLAGYPGMAGPIERPLIVRGIIASDPRHPATFGKAHLGNAVLCHSFSWSGMSGAPVLGISQSIGKVKLIGVNAGHVGGSGITGGVISHFVRSSALTELMGNFVTLPPLLGGGWRAETPEEIAESLRFQNPSQ
ncbi:S1 family peptidase [Mycobacterium nebraskense]|nr:serine protease [Mycobacterium nebraskense]MBI2697223.1 trypsin-like peptidase domain-containing protein [Mycobacterium nebraskense]MCV7116116.1 trypsin-like peptidase domain-containing protein [Mycobacterium nebraskense]